MPQPEFIYNSDPYTGQCSHCRGTFSIPIDVNDADRPQRLRQAFEQHIKGRHPDFLKEDASQAAARIVKGATENQ